LDLNNVVTSDYVKKVTTAFNTIRTKYNEKLCWIQLRVLARTHALNVCVSLSFE